jgi:hypothetical protein
MEDLERLVGVERDDRLRDRSEVPVDEVADRLLSSSPRTGAPGNEELEAGRAERVLRIDEEQAYARPSRADDRTSCSTAHDRASAKRASYSTLPHLAHPLRADVGRSGSGPAMRLYATRPRWLTCRRRR